MKTLLATILIVWTLKSYSQNIYPLQSADGSKNYGSYEIDNQGQFIPGRPGVLKFHFNDPDYKAEFVDTQIICNGRMLIWTPTVSSPDRTIIVKLLKNSDATVVDHSIPLTLPVKPNSPPKCVFGLCEATFTKVPDEELEIKLGNYIKDDDGDALSFVWVSNPASLPGINGDGTIKVPRTMISASNADKIGVVGVRDSESSLSFVVRIVFQPVIGPPRFSPQTDKDGNIYLEQVFQQGDDLTPFAIKAINPSDNSELPLQISGPTHGLTYDKGLLKGSFSYDIVSNDLKEDELGTVFTRSVKVSCQNSQGISNASLVFKIKWKAGPDQYKRYEDKRHAILEIVDDYRTTAMEKWQIIYGDLNKVKKKQEVMEAIGGGLQNLGGLSVFASSTPLTQIVGGLAIVQTQIASVLKNREKRILSNISILVKGLSDTSTPIEEFLKVYKERPEKQVFYTNTQLNLMDDQKMAIQKKLSEFQQGTQAIQSIF